MAFRSDLDSLGTRGENGSNAEQHFGEAQIATALRHRAADSPVADRCRELGISRGTDFRSSAQSFGPHRGLLILDRRARLRMRVPRFGCVTGGLVTSRRVLLSGAGWGLARPCGFEA